MSMSIPAGFEPTRWWKVVGPDGRLWCETSSEKEARTSMRDGDKIYRLFEKKEQQWIPEEAK